MPEAPPEPAAAVPAVPGGLLSGTALHEALFAGERIFRRGSADEAQVRGAGYELRLAGERMMVPVRPGSDEFEYRDDPNRSVRELVLQPGDSALIFSAERFSMDFDITCLIGPKFRWAARGLLVLQGMAAHPGYGREERDGLWVPKEDERLSLVVANIGPEPINMRRGEAIAYVQFFDVERPQEPRETRNVGYEDLTGTFRNGGLAYFKNVRDLRARVNAVEESQERRVAEALAAHTAQMAELRESQERLVREALAANRTEMTALQGRVDAAANDVDQVRNSTLNVVIFGVFLVAVTLLGIVVNGLVDVVKDLPPHVGTCRAILIGGLCLVYAVAAVWGVVAVVRHVSAKTDRKPDKQDGKKSAA